MQQRKPEHDQQRHGLERAERALLRLFWALCREAGRGVDSSRTAKTENGSHSAASTSATNQGADSGPGSGNAPALAARYAWQAKCSATKPAKAIRTQFCQCPSRARSAAPSRLDCRSGRASPFAGTSAAYAKGPPEIGTFDARAAAARGGPARRRLWRAVPGLPQLARCRRPAAGDARGQRGRAGARSARCARLVFGQRRRAAQARAGAARVPGALSERRTEATWCAC